MRALLPSHRSDRPSFGFTLLEALLAIALAALLLSAGWPSLRGWLVRQRMTHAAQSVLTDLQAARAEALMRNATVQWRFFRDADGPCYVLFIGATDGCDCRDGKRDGDGARCIGDARLLRAASWPLADGRPDLSANVPMLRFNGATGTVTPTGTVVVALAGVGEIRHVVGITGRVRSCATRPLGPRWERCA